MEVPVDPVAMEPGDAYPRLGAVGSNGSLRLLRCRWCEELDWFGSTIGEFDGGVNSGASTNLVGQLTEIFTIYRFGPSTI